MVDTTFESAAVGSLGRRLDRAQVTFVRAQNLSVLAPRSASRQSALWIPVLGARRLLGFGPTAFGNAFGSSLAESMQGDDYSRWGTDDTETKRLLARYPAPASGDSAEPSRDWFAGMGMRLGDGGGGPRLGGDTGSESAGPRVRTAANGDSWARIAREEYGDERYALALARANGAKGSFLGAGQDVRLPDLSGTNLRAGGAFIAADAAERSRNALSFSDGRDPRDIRLGFGYQSRVSRELSDLAGAQGISYAGSGGMGGMRGMSEAEGFFTFNPLGRFMAGSGNSAAEIVKSPYTLGKEALFTVTDSVGNATYAAMNWAFGGSQSYQSDSALFRSVDTNGALGTIGNGITGTVRSLPGIAQVDALYRNDMYALGGSVPGTALALGGARLYGDWSNVRLAQADQVRWGYLADDWGTTSLPAGTRVFGGLPGQSTYYTTAATVDAAAGSRTTLFQALQVEPHPEFGYRPMISEYEVVTDLRVPSGTALANVGKGIGGGEQFFIQNYSSSLQLIRKVPLGQ